MKQTLPFIVCLFILHACGGGNSKTPEAVLPETPEALQDHPDSKFKLEAYSRGGSQDDLIDALYNELVEHDPSLKQIEADFNTSGINYNEMAVKFNTFDTKSTDYYEAVKTKSKGISDSTMRQKMMNWLEHSQSQYNNRKSELQSLLKTMSAKGVSMNDHHVMLKIALTLPVMEKFQKEHLPDKKELKAILNGQDKLIKKTDSLIKRQGND